MFTIPFLLPLLFFTEIPLFDNTFWLALSISGTLNVIATILYMMALKTSNLSLVSPIQTFAPLFLLLTSPVILGELPRIFGVMGILLIVLGAYILNIRKIRKGILSSIKALIRDKGTVIMLTVAFIWSISSNFNKIDVQHSNPIVWSFVANIYYICQYF